MNKAVVSTWAWRIVAWALAAYLAIVFLWVLAVALHMSGAVQSYEHGVQIGWVFVDWHYLANPEARSELGS